jgi:F-type H+-transporting ATPase subunit alpha
VESLNQNERSPLPVEEQVAVVYAGTNGYLDRIAVSRVPDFLNDLGARLRAEQSDLMETIAGGEWEDSTQEALDAAIKEFADDFGYDLDEDGAPVADGGDSDRIRDRKDDTEAEAEARSDTEAVEEAATA